MTIVSQFLSLLYVTFLPVVVFFLTKNPITGPWRVLLALASLLWLMIDSLVFSQKNEKRKLIDMIIFILFLIGATNWFFSPFFFLLYYALVVVSLVFSSVTGFCFTASLLILLIFSGEGGINTSYDILILVLLAAMYPTALYIKRTYDISIRRKKK